MSAILGIDAAWTPHHPSGVALIRQTALGEWECVAVAPSYNSFLSQAGMSSSAPASLVFPAVALIEAARLLARTEVILIAADIPLSKKPICARRAADNRVSSLFGSRGCSAHSPNSGRPGRVSEEMRDSLRALGFELATKQDDLPTPSLIETYPHPALLSLMKASYRVPYKVSNSRRYWPKCDVSARRRNIIQALAQIQDRITEAIPCVQIDAFDECSSFQGLKRTEDMLDALVCAWVGILALNGKASALGDDDASIWIPTDAAWHDLITGRPASESFMQNVEKLPVQERAFFHDQ